MSATPSKGELRAAALAKRDALSEKQREVAAQALAKRGLPIEITTGMVVSGYSPIRNEIDPAPLMEKLAKQGARLALPTINARGKALVFRVWRPGDRLMLCELHPEDHATLKARFDPRFGYPLVYKRLASGGRSVFIRIDRFQTP